MKQRKNKFFTVVFSMMFGAGQMYMGFMKQGLSIMACAIGIISIGLITQMGIIYLLLPLLWFYGFFDSINKRSLSDEAFMKLEDASILPVEINTQYMKKFTDKYQIYIGGGFVFLGICILNNNILSYIFPRGAFIIRVIGPQFFLSLALIVIGLRLILNRRQELFKYWKSQNNLVEETYKNEEQSKGENETLLNTNSSIENG